MTRSTVIVLLGLAALIGCGDFDPASPGPAGEEPARGSAPEDRFIVTLSSSARPADVANGHGIKADLIYQHVLNGFAARIPPQAHAGLLRNPHVKRIEPDHLVMTTGTIQEGASWGLDRIDQRSSTLDGRYKYDHTGAGVTAYIVDTGIRYTHQEFGGRAVPGFDAFGGDGSDCHGHGTHVAGTVGSATFGVAKDVRLVSVRVINCNGSGLVSGVIAGLDWAAGQTDRPAVVNLSLGASANESMDEAIRRAVEAGLTVVAAAGNNDADACSYSPGRAPEAITTGAMDPNGGRSVFSNFGSCVDIFAPGRFITSTSSASDIAVTDMAGTSMAAPHVAGAAALVLEELPDASPAVVASTILNRATKGTVSKSNTRNNDLLYTLASDDSGGNNGGKGNNAPPNASFTVSCSGLVCTFTDRSTDQDGQVVAWAWNFDDGAGSAQQHPSRTYASSGTYRVTLTVTDDAGATGTTGQDVTVEEPDSDPPTAQFTFDCTDLVCDFSDQSTPVQSDLVRWEWDFGDGSVLSTSDGPSNPSHAYTTPGTYQVHLTVTDEAGGVGEATRNVVAEGISLSAQGTKNRGFNRIDLAWSGAAGDFVRILLDGAVLTTAPNSGQYTYSSTSRGKVGFTFQVCEASGTRCSAEIPVTF